MAHASPPDRFQQALALVGGAMLGYLVMIDWIGLWFHAPWQRWPWMAGGALITWAAYWGIRTDPHVSGSARRALWWGLLGLMGGYALQMVHLWNRAGVLAAGSLIPATLPQFAKALTHGDLERINGFLYRGLGNDTRWSSLCLLVVMVLLLILIARAGAWHLDQGLRDPDDPDRRAIDTQFLRRQRKFMLWALGMTLAIVLLQGLDPRPLDFAESLALSWSQQHFAIFGFLGGFWIESRRQRRARQHLLHPAAANPGLRKPRIKSIAGRSALV